MAVVALHSAATGLSALSTELDIIANNLANANTTGFKAMRANFEDLLYQEKAQPGVENANGDESPSGLYVGLGTRISNTQLDPAVGSPIETGRDLDVMIEGKGFFQVATRPDVGDGVGYTRAGNFFVNSEGDVVLGNSNGPRLVPPINVPEDAISVAISPDGVVQVELPGEVELQEIGTLQLASFVNTPGLTSIGGNLFIESEASGPPIVGAPGEGTFGSVLHKFLESSNVDPVRELVTMIKTQRAFEMNSQSIQAADNVLQVIGNLRRF